MSTDLEAAIAVQALLPTDDTISVGGVAAVACNAVIITDTQEHRDAYKTQFGRDTRVRCLENLLTTIAGYHGPILIDVYAVQALVSGLFKEIDRLDLKISESEGIS